jgi:hypothetical protein
VIDPHRLLAFAAMTVAFLVIPGPSVPFVVGRALAYGRVAALVTVIGNTLGAYVLVVAVGGWPVRFGWPGVADKRCHALDISRGNLAP